MFSPFLRLAAAVVLLLGVLCPAAVAAEVRRPNILLCIADDASYAHFGINGDPVVKTPNFDRVARDGVRFLHSFCSSPSCTPSRAAILTGRPFFQLEESGNLWSTLNKERFTVYPDLLEAAGYAVGLMRKGWGPGDFNAGGFSRNPAGPEFGSFAQFRKTVKEGQPWCFWFGSHEPHRPYQKGMGVRSGKDLAQIKVPEHLPDVEEVRSDLADYLTEIEQFDRDIGVILTQLEAAGELDRTLIVITSDNGLPFPRAKTNLYDSGTRMPLAIRWPERVPGGRVVEDFVSHTDFAPTFLEAAGLPVPEAMAGRSLMPVLTSSRSGLVDPARTRVFTGRERHTSARQGNIGYPARAIRTAEFLYIENLAAERWPAGDPKEYADIDGGPSKSFMMEHRDSASVGRLWGLAFERRPEVELYDLRKDPAQMENVAGQAPYAEAQAKLREELVAWRAAMHDPRLDPALGAAFDHYPFRKK